MDVMQRLANSIVVPVVVLDKVEDAIPTAKAMAANLFRIGDCQKATGVNLVCINIISNNNYFSGYFSLHI